MEWGVTPGNYIVLANVNISGHDKIKDQSKVKIRISTQVATLRTTKVTNNHEIFPRMLEAHYRHVWEKIGKHVFIEQGGG